MTRTRPQRRPAAATVASLIAGLLLGTVGCGDGRKKRRYTRSPGQETSLADKGRKLYRTLGCHACHSTKPGVKIRGGSLHGIFNRKVKLEDGRTLLRDERYLRTSILDPPKHIPEGFEPTMPSFRGRIAKHEIDALIAFIKSLKGG